MIHAHAGHRLVTITIHQRLHAEHIQLRIHHQLQPTLLDTGGSGQCRQLHQAVRHGFDALRQRRLNAQHRQRLIERRQRHTHLLHRQRHNVERFPVGGIHQHFKTFAHQHRQLGQFHRLRQETAVAGDDIQRTVVTGRQIQRAGVAAVEEAQTQPAARRQMLRILRAVGEHAIAKPAHRRAHHIQAVFDLCAFAQPLILQDHRNIILPPGFRQRQFGALLIFQQHQPRQPHHHLAAGFTVGMRVEPAGGRRLIDSEIHRARRAGMDQCLRAAIDVAGNFQAVPVDGAGLRQAVFDIDRHRLATLQLHRRPEQRAVESPGFGGGAGQPAGFPRLQRQRNFSLRVRLQQRRHRQGRPIGRPSGPAP